MLGDEHVARYARQIVVPGIGATGQEKLLESTVLVAGHPRGCRAARLYLEAAGASVIAETDALAGAPFDVAIVAGSPGAALQALLDNRAVPLCWYEIEANGFVAGVSPTARASWQQGSGAVGEAAAHCGSQDDSALHDAAACDAAACACAIVIGLRYASGPFRFTA